MEYIAQDFSHLKEGDEVWRMLAGSIPMKMRVISIKDGIIYAEPTTYGGFDVWQFKQTTGLEVDPSLEWDGEKSTGSFLTKTRLDPPKDEAEIERVKAVKWRAIKSILSLNKNQNNERI